MYIIATYMKKRRQEIKKKRIETEMNFFFIARRYSSYKKKMSVLTGMIHLTRSILPAGVYQHCVGEHINFL